jgi:anti-anti-sigma factor
LPGGARIDVHRYGPVVHVELAGELDCASRTELVETIDLVMTLPVLDQIVIDLREVEFLDSTTLGVLVMADRRARQAGIRLCFVKGSRAAQRPFELTHIDRHLTFVEL